MVSFKNIISIYFLSILVLSGCSGKKTNLQQYAWDERYKSLDQARDNLEEFFDGESYERTLKYIETYSVFSSPGDGFVQDIHRHVFSSISSNIPTYQEYYIKSEIWRDIPAEIWHDQILKTLIDEQKLDDKKHALDFTPHLALKRCAKLYGADSDKVSKIKICLLLYSDKISNLEELKIQTELFGLVNKVALDFADPFGNFIFKNDLSLLLHVPSAEEEIEYRGLTDTISYIKIKSFESSQLANAVGRVVNNFDSSGENKIILDLRGNKGGIKDVTAEVASLFLPTGAPFLLFRERNNRGQWNEPQCELIENRHFAKREFKGPMIVLTDHGTASAGEVLVAALQANKRALIIGQKTFGKGIGFLVGRLNELGYKSNGVMTLSTLVLYHPATEKCWHLDPIAPDIILEEEIISRSTIDEWEDEKDKFSYRMKNYNHISNRELGHGLKTSVGALKKCLQHGGSIPQTNAWDSFIKDQDLQQKLLEEGREKGFEDDLPLYLAIKGLEYFDVL